MSNNNNNNNNRVGEDKLSKMVRLLAKYEQELGMVEERVNVHIDSTGTGYLGAGYATMFTFDNVKELIDFLESSQLERTILTRFSVKKGG